MNLLFVFLFCFAVRVASVFIVQTFYVPDEYWQSLEVAHKITFGYVKCRSELFLLLPYLIILISFRFEVMGT